MYGKPRVYETKTIKSNGCTIHLFKEKDQDGWKMHNWDGPAVDPLTEEDKSKKEYYLYGKKLTLEQWEEARKNREGLPWYKNASMKGATRF
jgi:hypothetical protein